MVTAYFFSLKKFKDGKIILIKPRSLNLQYILYFKEYSKIKSIDYILNKQKTYKNIQGHDLQLRN